ncbi:hypothetical protein QYE76_020150 [Lolium multiflorum]|uniref:Uncharacterized protein n=1 Tax=Lolium multiflorum TaxID=4521 RepID=A0AAD8R4A4_LOLMU|nr:hypothetical protein QYE76_020150 [Lolium multiflorum]
MENYSSSWETTVMKMAVVSMEAFRALPVRRRRNGDSVPHLGFDGGGYGRFLDRGLFLSEAPPDFYTATDTTPSCCRIQEELLLPLPAGMGRWTSSSSTTERVTEYGGAPFVAPEPIVIKIFYALLQAASERLPQQQEPPLVGFGISSGLESDLQKRFEHHDPHELMKELKTIFETHAAVECYEALFQLLGINRVLQSPPPSYKNFVMNYNMRNMNKEFPELFGMLKAAEIEIKKEHQVLMVNKTTSFKKQGKSKENSRRVARKLPRLL